MNSCCSRLQAPGSLVCGERWLEAVEKCRARPASGGQSCWVHPCPGLPLSACPHWRLGHLWHNWLCAVKHELGVDGTLTCLLGLPSALGWGSFERHSEKHLGPRSLPSAFFFLNHLLSSSSSPPLLALHSEPLPDRCGRGRWKASGGSLPWSDGVPGRL